MAENAFVLGSSRIAPIGSTQGSKVILAWVRSQRWIDDPPMVRPEDVESLEAHITYPKPGGGQGMATIKCRNVDNINVNVDPVLVTCEFDGDIHSLDSATFTAPAGWLKNQSGQIDTSQELTTQNTTGIANNSEVPYPQPVASWDMVPHVVIPPPTFPGAPVNVDIAAVHRYSFPNSPFGASQSSITGQTRTRMPAWLRRSIISSCGSALSFRAMPAIPSD